MTMVMMTWPFVGTLLGVVFAYALIVRPAMRVFLYLLAHPETQMIRGHAHALAFGLIPTVLAFLACAPISITARTK